ncbi:sulfate transporter CysZ [Aestuariirhabdus litorea]|uniref:Sulfate transporter CysZ n=1 Tax=Aestuariirhabdus litorea TaxID=2528527 RepID=A0A3P3VRW7_9GAMM|nr:sulfate transporter CysZ [Aestuariirhabdus litorea]RRJ85370.1 sulfate transporter CysZ [Aestuariirhabdus litorea]RWW98594.1 sulfate transporter CysZ [Endozoicomonadaceae bacterium GTF-13]
MLDLARGGSAFLAGFGLLTRPGLRGFVVVPLLINIVLFSLLIYVASDQFSTWVQRALDWLPEWLSFLDWLMWPLFALTIVVILFFSFTIVANLIAAPFNGLLSEVCERQLRAELGEPGQEIPFSWKELGLMVPRTLAREVTKLLYFAPRALLLLIISWIPLLNLAAPLLWALFGAWTMAIQYIDYAADNNRMTFKEMLLALKRRRLLCLGFGGCVSLLMLIPLINLLIMPAAVTGATRLWVSERLLNETQITPSHR